MHVLHSLGLLKLANLLDMIHQVSTIHVLHDKVQAVLPSKRQGKEERIQTLHRFKQKKKLKSWTEAVPLCHILQRRKRCGTAVCLKRTLSELFRRSGDA